MQPSAKARIPGKSPEQVELERLFFEAAMRQEAAKLSEEVEMPGPKAASNSRSKQAKLASSARPLPAPRAASKR